MYGLIQFIHSVFVRLVNFGSLVLCADRSFNSIQFSSVRFGSVHITFPRHTFFVIICLSWWRPSSSSSSWWFWWFWQVDHLGWPCWLLLWLLFILPVFFIFSISIFPILFSLFCCCFSARRRKNKVSFSFWKIEKIHTVHVPIFHYCFFVDLIFDFLVQLILLCCAEWWSTQQQQSAANFFTFLRNFFNFHNNPVMIGEWL